MTFIPSETNLDIARGLSPGKESVAKFGNNSNVGTTEEDVWGVGGFLLYLTSAETMDIVSDDADDNSAGSGARTLFVQGVDASYNPVSETINMNGLGTVTTVNSYLRVFSMVVLTAGASAVNEGTITATATTSLTTQAQIGPGDGQALMTHFTVSAGRTAYLSQYYYSINKKTSLSADMRLFVRPFGGAWNLKSILGGNSLGDNSDGRSFEFPIEITEKSDIRITAIGSASAGDISAGFDLVMIDN